MCKKQLIYNLWKAYRGYPEKLHIKNNLYVNPVKVMDSYQINHKNNAPFVVVMEYYHLLKECTLTRFYVQFAKVGVNHLLFSVKIVKEKDIQVTTRLSKYIFQRQLMTARL